MHFLGVHFLRQQRSQEQCALLDNYSLFLIFHSSSSGTNLHFRSIHSSPVPLTFLGWDFIPISFWEDRTLPIPTIALGSTPCAMAAWHRTPIASSPSVFIAAKKLPICTCIHMYTWIHLLTVSSFHHCMHKFVSSSMSVFFVPLNQSFNHHGLSISNRWGCAKIVRQ